MRFDSKDAREHHSRLVRSRQLRQEMPVPEIKVWNRLRAARLGGLKIRRQHRVGPYFADFYCAAAMLVVELDGQIHDRVRDAERDAYLSSLGIEVLRITVSDFEKDEEGAYRAILSAATRRLEEKKANTPSPASKTRPPLPEDWERKE